MARLILVEGLAGTGKSTGWENIPAEQAAIISPNGKPLPFPGSSKKYTRYSSQNTSGNVIMCSSLTKLPEWITWVASASHIKYLLIDDYTHFFNKRIMAKSFIAQTEGGAAFAKWNQFGADVHNSIFALAEQLRDDLTIVINHHVELDEMGKYKFKTSGKLLDKVIDPVSYFTYVFHARVLNTDNGIQYVYQTNFDGVHEAKTPRGAFTDMFIHNDVKAIIDRIEEYENAM